MLCVKLPLSLSAVILIYFSNDGSEFVGSVSQKVSSKLETAVQINWTAGSNDTRFGFGAKYCPDKDTTVRVRGLLKF